MRSFANGSHILRAGCRLIACACVYMCVCVCVCVYMCAFMCMCVYVYVWVWVRTWYTVSGTLYLVWRQVQNVNAKSEKKRKEVLLTIFFFFAFFLILFLPFFGACYLQINYK